MGSAGPLQPSQPLALSARPSLEISIYADEIDCGNGGFGVRAVEYLEPGCFAERRQEVRFVIIREPVNFHAEFKCRDVGAQSAGTEGEG